MKNLQGLLKQAISAAIEAGNKTLEYYGKDIQINLKEDESPLTQADLESNKIIEKELFSTGIPLLSEESKPEAFEKRKNWSELWIVDPLDGTKEFIKKSDEYTINIALVVKRKPVLGVVFVPAKNWLYYGLAGDGAFKIDLNQPDTSENYLNQSHRISLPAMDNASHLVLVASRSHRNEETNRLINEIEQKVENIDIQSFGSSLKLCMIAEGKADIYPRLGPTMEWDTAASHAIVEAAGMKIFQYPSFKDVIYNKEDLLNPWFIVYHPRIEKAIR